MTILNIWATPERAVVAVDTATHSFDGARGYATKIVPLFHSNCIVAGRGSISVLAGVLHPLLSVPKDYEAAHNTIAEQLPAHMKFVDNHAAGQGSPFRVGAQQIALVGWSTTAKRVCVALFYCDGKTFHLDDDDRAFLPDPGTDMASIVAEPFSTVAMMRTAREQVEWAKSTGIGHTVGGDLIYAEVSAQGLSIRSLGAI